MTGTTTDWARAIERNSEALKGIVAALFAMLGLEAAATILRLQHGVQRAVLPVLQPAESASWRLIVIAWCRAVQIPRGELKNLYPCSAGNSGS